MTTPTPRAERSKNVARALLNSGCVQVRTDEPFRLPSGWTSPVYMDCRRFISFPAVRRNLVSCSLEMLQSSGCLNGVTAIAGGEASGIALAAWIAEALDLPLQYVRKKPRAETWIEGVVRPGERVLLVDDLMAAGHSKRMFCRALTSANATVEDIFVIFNYGTFPTQKLLANLGVTVHALATWQDVLAVAHEDDLFDPPILAEIGSFLDNPSDWSEAHGGVGNASMSV